MECHLKTTPCVRTVTLDEILENRDQLIDQLELGTLDKRAFLESTHSFFIEIGYKPCGGEVTSVEQGLIDYQYYNAFAKYHMMLKEELEFKDSRASQMNFNRALDYYTLKDRVTLGLVAIKGYKNMDAYYMELHSKALEGSLFEIVLHDENRVVMHSKDKRILYRLEQNGVFKGETRKSVIDDYVNQRY